MKLLLLKILGWTTKILGTSIFVFVVFMIAAHVINGAENGTEKPLSTIEVIMSIGGICSVIGLGIALFREGIGGLLTTLGMVLFFSASPNQITNPGYFGLTFLIGLLYLLYWFLKRKELNK